LPVNSRAVVPTAAVASIVVVGRRSPTEERKRRRRTEEETGSIDEKYTTRRAGWGFRWVSSGINAWRAVTPLPTVPMDNESQDPEVGPASEEGPTSQVPEV
jgi:hypothetical protein